MPQSAFRPFPETKLVSRNRLQEAIERASRYKNTEESRWQELSSRLYEWLDALSGYTSFYALRKEDYFERGHMNVIAKLRREGVLKNWWMNSDRYNDCPPLLRVGLTPHYPAGATDGRILQRSYAHGIGEVSIAFSKAIGEFLERYFLTLYKKKSLLRASIEQLERKGFRFVHPEILSQFSDEQKERRPECRWDGSSLFHWEKAVRCRTGEETYIPAQCLYWNYIRDREAGEPTLVETNTNGAGGYFSQEGAILAGLYELVQRDSFLLHWLRGVPPPQIDPKSVPDERFQTLRKSLLRYRLRPYILNTTLDTGIPSFAAVLEDTSVGGSGYAVAGGCEADPIAAIYRATEEALSVHYWMRPEEYFQLPDHYAPFYDNTIGQRERLRLWANPAMKARLQFFLGGRVSYFEDVQFSYPKRFPGAREELQCAVEAVERLGDGYEVYSFLPSHPLLQTLGYASARVIVPRIVPLYLQEQNIPLGNIRLRDAGERLFSDVVMRESINPDPHPFP